MRVLTGSLALTAVLSINACGGDELPDLNKAAKQNKETTACLEAVEKGASPALAVRECSATCDEGADKQACGALALAHTQALGEELAVYMRFLRPQQSPTEFMAASGLDARLTEARASAFEAHAPIDIRSYEFVIAPIIEALRGIREAAYYFVEGNGDAEIGLKKVPLAPGIAAFLYGDLDSFAMKGDWTARDVATLGAVANLLLGVVDVVFSQNLVIDLPEDMRFDSISVILATAVEVLERSPGFLTVNDEGTLALARDELHAAFSLLTGRDDDLEGVAKANVGLLGMIAHGFGVDGEDVLADRFSLIRDVDGDGQLSRGDAIKVTFSVNDKDVEVAFPYPISAKLTADLFDFLGAITGNLDGSGSPAAIAEPINAAMREFSAFGQLLGVRAFPNALALDVNTFFDEFTGIRHLLPYWYKDEATTGTLVNDYYFEDASTATTYFITYEHELSTDSGHFAWTDDETIDWMEFAEAPAGFDADGIELAPASGHYVLMQNPDFSGLLQVNTSPFIGGDYGMLSELSTGNEFARPDNRQLNAVLNALIVWTGF